MLINKAIKGLKGLMDSNWKLPSLNSTQDINLTKAPKKKKEKQFPFSIKETINFYLQYISNHNNIYFFSKSKVLILWRFLDLKM